MRGGAGRYQRPTISARPLLPSSTISSSSSSSTDSVSSSHVHAARLHSSPSHSSSLLPEVLFLGRTTPTKTANGSRSAKLMQVRNISHLQRPQTVATSNNRLNAKRKLSQRKISSVETKNTCRRNSSGSFDGSFSLNNFCRPLPVSYNNFLVDSFK